MFMLNRPLFGKHVASSGFQLQGPTMQQVLRWECYTLPERDEHFAPENGWLEDVCRSFLGIFGLFSGANLLLVSGSVA